MSKAKSKTKQGRGAERGREVLVQRSRRAPTSRKARLALALKTRRIVDLKPREPKTFQKTVRVPREILTALECEAGKVKDLTVPAAIVQILEDWYKKRESAKAAASKSA